MDREENKRNNIHEGFSDKYFLHYQTLYIIETKFLDEVMSSFSLLRRAKERNSWQLNVIQELFASEILSESVQFW